MKSIFKRAFAAVTSTALVFSQVAATAVSAVDLPLTVNKAWVLKVPYDQKVKGSTEEGSALKTYLDLSQMEVKTEDSGEVLVFKNDEAKLSNLLSSRWNDELESLMSARLGSKDSITQETDATQLKKMIKENLIGNIERITTLLKAKLPSSIGSFGGVDKVLDQAKLIDDDTAKKIEDAIHDKGTMTITAAGTAKEVVHIDEIGPEIGKAIVKYFEKYFGSKFEDTNGNPIEFDWSNYHIFGDVEVTADYSKFDKNVKYSVVFVDEKGNKISTFDALSQYFLKKGINTDPQEPGGVNIMQDGCKNAKSSVQKQANDAMKIVNEAYENKDVISSIAEMFQGISFEEDDPNDAYGEYIKLAEAGLESVGIPSQYVKKFVDTFNAKRPKNLYEAADKADKNPKISKIIEQGIGFIHKIAGDKAKVELTVTDVTDIMKNGTNWQTKFPNGYSTDNMFDYTVDADELESLKNAVVKYKEEEIKEQFKKKVTGVEAHRRITLNSENNYTSLDGAAFYNVELVIDKILLEDIVETTVTTTVTTTSGTETDTEATKSETTSGSETTASQSGTGTETTASQSGSETGTETTASQSGTGTETTASQSGSTTETTASQSDTGTETTASQSGTGTETTASQSGTGTETTASQSGTGTETTASESGTGTETTASQSGTGTETSTTPASSLEFVQSGMPGELIYWSEETTDFTFTNMKVTMNIYKLNDDKTSYVLDKSADVTSAFEPSAKSPKDFEFKGFDQYTIDYKLKDASVISKQISLAGYDADALMKQDGITDGFKAKGSTPLYLVLRGDSNLDNVIDITDAKWALDYQVATAQTNYTMEQAFEKKLVKAKDNNYNNLKFQHYAADVFNGDGLIETRDAKAILDYFVAVKQTMLPGAEAWTYKYYLMEGKPVTPNDQLHADPYRFDTKASYAKDDAAHITAE